MTGTSASQKHPPGGSRRVSLPTLILTLVLGAACDGAILDPGASGAMGGGGGGGGNGGGNPGLEGPDGVGERGPELPAETTRFPRLTHRQWENTVTDLFGLPDGVADAGAFRQDPQSAGFLFDDDANHLEVDQTLWQSYQRAAEEVARVVAEDPALLGVYAPADGELAARAEAFVDAFGAAAFRRPLTDDEGQALVGLHETGRSLYPGVGPFEAGARLVIEAVLQSPFFLYRVETSEELGAGGLIPLSSWEVATRLSYALWDSMPDEVLFARAAADELHDLEVVAAEAERMIDDPRAADTVARFHGQLLDTARFETIRPNRDAFPETPRNLAALAVTESDLFLRDVWERGLGFIDLLTSTETFVNADLAAVYGLDATGLDDEFSRVSLDPARRRGVFTQVGFLAKNATALEPDPIHRGVFLSERIACNPIGVPPAEIPPLPPGMGQTNRERVASHTEQPGTPCAQCHRDAINPFGFAFEHYDATGAWRDLDNGFEIDTAAAPLIGGETLPVDDAVGLAETLAASEVVHRCYVKHAFELVHARTDGRVDDPLLSRVTDRSLAGASVRELVVALVATPAFIYRAPLETDR